jgi:hypothetical protein
LTPKRCACCRREPGLGLDADDDENHVDETGDWATADGGWLDAKSPSLIVTSAVDVRDRGAGEDFDSAPVRYVAGEVVGDTAD